MIALIVLVLLDGLIAAFCIYGTTKCWRSKASMEMEIDLSYRTGLERGRQEGGQNGFKAGFDFAGDLMRKGNRQREFPIGVVIWPKSREGEKVS